MATVVNFMDTTLQAATARGVNLPTADIQLLPDSPGFHVAADGTITPASITVTATLVDLEVPALNFNSVGGDMTNVAAKSVSVAGSSMSGTSATVIASATVNGKLYTKSCTIWKVQDGAPGTSTPGARGAGHYYASGSAWTDALANVSVPSPKVVGDVVTISSGTFVMEKHWTGSAWVDNGVVIDGKLIVPQSITAGTIDTRGLSIRDSAGNIILAAGSALATDYAAAGTKNTELVPSIQAAATTSTWPGTSGRPSDEAIRNNLVDLSSWVRLGSMPWPANGEYNVLANSLADFGVQGPKGVDDVIWYAEEKGLTNNPNGDNPGGGWNDAPVTLDPTKKYRFVLPIFRRSGGATAFWGIRNVAALNTTTIASDNNPYFAASGTLTAGRWYLFVGYIFPANSIGNTSDSAGIWDCSTGEKVAGGTNYNFLPGTGNIVHRAYQYYASNGAQQLFGRPMVNLIDGAEPSLREYFAASALLNNKITMGADGSLQGAGGGKVTLPGMGQNTFRIYTHGNQASSRPAGLVAGCYKNGAAVVDINGRTANYSRSYNLVVIRRSDMVVTWVMDYDVYGSGSVGSGKKAYDLAVDLNNLADAAGQYIVILYTADEPAQNRGDSGLPEAIYRNGGSRSVFTLTTQFKAWSAYVLVAISGCGEGNAVVEKYRGDAEADPNAWIDVALQMQGGEIIGGGANYARALNDKLNASASSILRAPIAIATGGGVVVGSLAYDANSGSRLYGNGVAITPYGIIGHNGTKYTFAINASNGYATFGGQLDAAFGTFGALRIASGGSIAQGAYDGSWAWPAVGGKGYLLHEKGILFGNANDPNQFYFQLDIDTSGIYMPGFSYTGRQLTLDNPVIINPKLTLANRTVSISSPSGTSFTHGRTTSGGYCGSHTGSISGAANPSYLWTVTGYPGTQMIISGASSATCGLSVVGPGGRDTGGGPIDASYDLTCTVSDGGVTKSSTQTIWVTFT